MVNTPWPRRMLQMDCKTVQQLYICNRNFRELSEKPYMIITQVPKVHLEKIMFVNYHCFTVVLNLFWSFRLHRGRPHVLRVFPGEAWGREMKKTVSFRLSQEKDKLPAITSSSQHFSESSRWQNQCEKEMTLYRKVAKSS